MINKQSNTEFLIIHDWDFFSIRFQFLAMLFFMMTQFLFTGAIHRRKRVICATKGFVFGVTIKMNSKHRSNLSTNNIRINKTTVDSNSDGSEFGTDLNSIQIGNIVESCEIGLSSLSHRGTLQNKNWLEPKIWKS